MPSFVIGYIVLIIIGGVAFIVLLIALINFAIKRYGHAKSRERNNRM
jgi:type III secretory pathway component EscU